MLGVKPTIEDRYTLSSPTPSSINLSLEDMLFELGSEEEKQLCLPLGPPPEFTIMFKRNNYAAPLNFKVNSNSVKDDSFGYILARPKSFDIEFDSDGEIHIKQLEISKVLSLYDLWEAAQTTDLTIEEYLSQKFLESKMDV